MTPARTALSFAAIGAASLLVLGFAAWKLAPGDAPPPATPAARVKSAVAPVSRKAPPAEKPCLPPPSDVGPEEMVASAGLDADAVRSVMRTAIQGSLRCFSGSPSVELMLSVNVACSGRVAKVDVDEDGGATAEVQGCVREAIRSAEFPAHALPDGDTFQYPLRYTAPE